MICVLFFSVFSFQFSLHGASTSALAIDCCWWISNIRHLLRLADMCRSKSSSRSWTLPTLPPPPPFVLGVAKSEVASAVFPIFWSSALLKAAFYRQLCASSASIDFLDSVLEVGMYERMNLRGPDLGLIDADRREKWPKIQFVSNAIRFTDCVTAPNSNSVMDICISFRSELQ